MEFFDFLAQFNFLINFRIFIDCNGIERGHYTLPFVTHFSALQITLPFATRSYNMDTRQIYRKNMVGSITIFGF